MLFHDSFPFFTVQYISYIICIQEPDRPASNISDACANEVYQELLNCCARYDCQQAIDSVQVNISTILVSTKKVLILSVSFALQVFSLVSEIFSCATSELLAEFMWLPTHSNESRHPDLKVSFRLCQYKVCLIRPYLCHVALVAVNSWRWKAVRTC